MRRALLLLAALAAAAAEGVPRFYHENVGIALAERLRAAEAARVVGGSAAPPGAHPYLGGLLVALTSGRTSICGSTLLSPTRGLTAAHCWWDGMSQASQFTVVLGSSRLFSGGTRVVTSDVQLHANWNTINLNNDIAIMALPRVELSDAVAPVALPSGLLLFNSFAGWTATAAGFGRTGDGLGIESDAHLSHVDVPVLANAVCAEPYGSPIISSTLCTSGAGGRGVCGGDTGGPLVVSVGGRRVLIGVASFYSPRGCTVTLPSAYARVTSFASWIQERL